MFFNASLCKEFSPGLLGCNFRWERFWTVGEEAGPYRFHCLYREGTAVGCFCVQIAKPSLCVSLLRWQQLNECQPTLLSFLLKGNICLLHPRNWVTFTRQHQGPLEKQTHGAGIPLRRDVPGFGSKGFGARSRGCVWRKPSTRWPYCPR